MKLPNAELTTHCKFGWFKVTWTIMACCDTQCFVLYYTYCVSVDAIQIQNIAFEFIMDESPLQ